MIGVAVVVTVAEVLRGAGGGGGRRPRAEPAAGRGFGRGGKDEPGGPDHGREAYWLRRQRLTRRSRRSRLSCSHSLLLVKEDCSSTLNLWNCLRYSCSSTNPKHLLTAFSLPTMNIVALGPPLG